nr:unnamed protein product [Haemonchus contortus]
MVMDRFLSIFLAVAVVTDYANSMTLLDRHLTKLQNPSDPSTHLNEMKFSVHHNFAGGSDAIVGPRPHGSSTCRVLIDGAVAAL